MREFDHQPSKRDGIAHLVMIGRVEGLFRCRSDFRVVVDGEVGMDYGARIEEGTGCASTTAAST
jgi:hypothetical protein